MPVRWGTLPGQNSMRYFDAHTHLQFVAYERDHDAAVERAREAGVGVNLVGTQIDTSRAAVALAHKHEEAWATIGLHPVHTTRSYHDTAELGKGGKEFTSRGEVFDANAYEKLGRDPKVIAIGECGLDYYRNDPITAAAQRHALMAQIDLANRLKKPLMLHVRPSKGSQDAYRDALALVESSSEVKGDVHFFAGNWDTAKQWLDLGFTLSFTGVLTFTHDYDEVVQHTPLDMLLSETDAPYITPVPHRGTRNESAYIPLVVQAIARIKKLPEEEVRLQLLANAERVFGLK